MTPEQRAELEKTDAMWLVRQPQFVRFLLTVTKAAGIYGAHLGADTNSLRELEGRRSLGFDIIYALEAVCPTLRLSLAQAEFQTLMETPDGPQQRYDSDGNDDGSGNSGRRGSGDRGDAGSNFVNYAANDD